MNYKVANIFFDKNNCQYQLAIETLDSKRSFVIFTDLTCPLFLVNGQYESQLKGLVMKVYSILDVPNCATLFAPEFIDSKNGFSGFANIIGLIQDVYLENNDVYFIKVLAEDIELSLFVSREMTNVNENLFTGAIISADVFLYTNFGDKDVE